MNKYKYRNRKYEVVEYNSLWSQNFKEESQRLKNVFGPDALKVEHVGSTAVAGLAAKPTIDILIIVDRVAVADKYNEAMIALGYRALGAFIADDTRLFEKEIDGERKFIIHTFEKRHSKTEDMIKVRDYLITHPEETRAYETLKKELKSRFPDDYISYRKVKDEYMKKLTARALEADIK